MPPPISYPPPPPPAQRQRDPGMAGPVVGQNTPVVDTNADLEAQIAAHRAWMEMQLALLHQQQQQAQQGGSTLPNTAPPPVDGTNPYAGYPSYSAHNFNPNQPIPNRTTQPSPAELIQMYGPPEDLSNAQVFGRKLETSS